MNTIRSFVRAFVVHRHRGAVALAACGKKEAAPAEGAAAAAGRRREGAEPLHLERLPRRRHHRQLREGNRHQGVGEQLRQQRGARSKLAPGQLRATTSWCPRHPSYERQIKAGLLPEARQVAAAEPEEHGPGHRGAPRDARPEQRLRRAAHVGHHGHRLQRRRRSRRPCRMRRSTAGSWCSTRTSRRTSRSAASPCSTPPPRCTAWRSTRARQGSEQPEARRPRGRHGRA